MSVAAEHSSHNKMQGPHLHVSRGDNVICINLMSLFGGEKKPVDTCGNKLTLFKSLFFFPPLLLTILALA